MSDDTESVNPRWIDYHFPDYWLIARLGHFRRLVRRTRFGWIDKGLARYSLRYVHCLAATACCALGIVVDALGATMATDSQRPVASADTAEHKLQAALHHAEAIADTGDGYVLAKGHLIRCCWCDWYAVAPTKAEAVEKYRVHERLLLDLAFSAHQEVSRG